METKLKPRLILLAAMTAVFIYLWALLHAESQLAVGALLLLVVGIMLGLRRLNWSAPLGMAVNASPTLLGAGCAVGVLALIVALYDVHFALLLLSTVLLYAVVCLGLNVQFGYVGVVNFAGAAFFGIGSYTAATLATHTADHLVGKLHIDDSAADGAKIDADFDLTLVNTFTTAR